MNSFETLTLIKHKKISEYKKTKKHLLNTFSKMNSLDDYNIYFCKNQHEMYNLAIFSIIKSFSYIVEIPHIICSSMEHPIIQDILNMYKTRNLITISYIQVNIYGSTLAKEIEKHISKKTCMVIVSPINYLLGSVNNLKIIAETVHKFKIPLFSDNVYYYGKYNSSITDNGIIDITTVSLYENGTSLLIIKKSLFDGYKLQNQSLKFDRADDNEEIEYSKIDTLLKAVKLLKSKTNLKIYLYSCMVKHCLKSANTVYYYDNIVKNNIVAKKGDIIIFGYDVSDEKSNQYTISFIYVDKKIKKPGDKYLYKVTEEEVKLFEHIGLTDKWAKKVIVVSLCMLTKVDINNFIKSF